MNEIQYATKCASKLLTQKVETKLLAVCDVTGIAITIEAPAIGYALQYTNPIASPSNFLQLVELPFSTLAKFEPCILAGLVLAVLKNWDMIEETPASFTAAEQNLLLQTVPPYTLISYIRFMARNLSIYKRAYSYLPKLSLTTRAEGEKFYSNFTQKLTTHHKDCYEKLYPTKDVEELSDIYDEVDRIAAVKSAIQKKTVAEAILRARRTKEAQQKASLIEGRKLLKQLKESSPLSDKFLSFLSILLSGDYLVTAEEATKERAIQALAKHQLPLCNQLIKVLKEPCFKATAESIFAHEDDIEVEETLEAVEEEEVKPTNPLAALLKAKLAAMTDKRTLPRTQIEANENEATEDFQEIEDFPETEETEEDSDNV